MTFSIPSINRGRPAVPNSERYRNRISGPAEWQGPDEPSNGRLEPAPSPLALLAMGMMYGICLGMVAGWVLVRFTQK